MKTCSVCQLTSEQTPFPKTGGKCKPCLSAHRKQRYGQVRAQVAERRRRRYKTDEAYRTKVLSHCTRYQNENAATISAKNKVRYEGNRESRLAKNQVYRLVVKAPLREYLDIVKSGPCADCGKRFPSVAMDFDHVRGTKFKAVSVLFTSLASIDVLRQEIEKCDLVCACCHRVRTKSRKGARSYHSGLLADFIDQARRAPCLDCGQIFPVECMDFDHRDPSQKSFNISRARPSWGQDRLNLVEQEIAKCDVVCACCHRVRTYQPSRAA